MATPVATQHLYEWDDTLDVARLAVPAGHPMPDDVGELLTLAELGDIAERAGPAAPAGRLLTASPARAPAAAEHVVGSDHRSGPRCQCGDLKTDHRKVRGGRGRCRIRGCPCIGWLPADDVDDEGEQPSADDVSTDVELCPGCGYREVNDEKSGFCLECTAGATLRVTKDEDARRARARNKAWRDWRDEQLRNTPAGQESAAIRSTRKRVRNQLRPKHKPDPRTDPWWIAYQAIRHLQILRPTLREATTGIGGQVEESPVDRLNEVIELVRQLAWGPAGEMA